MVISPGRVLHGNVVSPAAVANTQTHTHTTYITHTHTHSQPEILVPQQHTCVHVRLAVPGCQTWWQQPGQKAVSLYSSHLQQSSESFLSPFLLIPLTESSVLCSNTNLSLKLQQTVWHAGGGCLKSLNPQILPDDTVNLNVFSILWKHGSGKHRDTPSQQGCSKLCCRIKRVLEVQDIVRRLFVSNRGWFGALLPSASLLTQSFCVGRSKFILSCFLEG